MGGEFVSKNDESAKAGMGGLDASCEGDEMLVSFDEKEFADRQYDFPLFGKPRNGRKRLPRMEKQWIRSGIVNDMTPTAAEARKTKRRLRNTNGLVDKKLTDYHEKKACGSALDTMAKVSDGCGMGKMSAGKKRQIDDVGKVDEAYAVFPEHKANT